MLGALSTVYGQFSLVGEIRPRAEFRNGFKTLNKDNTDPAFFIEQRSRLYFGYQADKINFKLSLQDVRIWGNANQIYKEDPALANVYEAWAEYKLSSKWAVKAGRQELNYDNARFLGNLGWAQQGRSHDALLLTFKDSSGTQLHVGGAFNQNVPFEPGKLASTFYSGVNNYKTIQYAWLHKDIGNSNFSVLVFNDGRQAADSTMNFRQTYGFFGNTKVGSVKLQGELYYQGGKNGGGTDVSAYMIALNATLPTKITPLTIGFDYLSGTEATDDKDKSFAPLYGTNHKFYGLMDYFYVGNPHNAGGKNIGLVDIFLKTNFKLSEKSSLMGHLHYFSSPVSIKTLDGSGDASTGLGTEIDLVWNVNMSKWANFKLGYSQMFATETMGIVKGANHDVSNNWAWAMLTIKPELFKSK